MRPIKIVILCALLLMPYIAMADPAEIGKVACVEGRVDVMRPPDNEAVPLVEGSSLLVGDAIRTKDHSKAEIAFADKSVVKIAPNTRMEIRDFSVNKGAREHAEVYITRGKIFADVSKTGKPDTFTITTPNAKGHVKGTEVIVFYQAERTNALVKDGRLSICNTALPDQKKEIAGGEATLVSFDTPPQDARTYMDAEFAIHEKDTKPIAFKAISLRHEATKMNGVITELVGGVRVVRKGATDWHYIQLKDIVEEGDRIETGADGRVSILFENGNILQMQANSRINLSTLKKDPKTGEFDNTFESDTGQIKTVVEKLGKNSTFRVKTPTALCGVRGTIMYVNVNPTATQAFYEGGSGVVTNTISGDTKFVESGQNTVSTNTGAVAAPATTTTEAKMTLEASYSYGVVQGGGYSAPENTATGTGTGAQTGTGAGTNAGTQGGATTSAFQPPPALVPITEANKPKATSGVTYVESLTYTADVDKVGISTGNTAALIPESGNQVNGLFSILVSVNNEWKTVDYVEQGAGSVTGNIKSVANIPASYAFWVDDDIRCQTVNGGQYRGFLGACMSTSSDSGKTTLWGKALCLYRDPSGMAGTMTFLFAGKYDPADKAFYTIITDCSSAVFTPREFEGKDFDLNSATLTTGAMYGRGKGYFDDASTTSSITCGATGLNTGLAGETFDLDTDWGIWQFQAQGTYDTTGSLNHNVWTLALGGERLDVPQHPTYWLGTVYSDGIYGGFWDDVGVAATNQFTADFRGLVFYNSYHDPAAINPDVFEGGYILGGNVAGIAYPGSNNWQAIGGGQFLIAYKNFTSDKLGFTAADLQSFVNVPISQVAMCTDIQRTAGAFTSFNMNAQVYTNAVATVWGGDITGTFLQSSQPSAGWTVTLQGTTPDAASITFKNGTWDAIQKTWSAVVDTSASPSIGGHTITSGQAGGTMTFNGDSSTIEGIAAGKAT